MGAGGGASRPAGGPASSTQIGKGVCGTLERIAQGNGTLASEMETGDLGGQLF